MDRAINTGPREWDADTYDEVSDPQFEWGLEVLERLELSGDETALDAGCGSGRVAAELLKRLPDGRLIAECGGEGNVAEYAQAIASAAARPEFARHFEGMSAMWNFAAPDATEEALRNAGFSEVRCWLQPKPVTSAQPLEFIATVTLGPHLGQLPEELRRPFAEAVLAEAGEPLTLDYVRLDIEARA